MRRKRFNRRIRGRRRIPGVPEESNAGRVRCFERSAAGCRGTGPRSRGPPIPSNGIMNTSNARLGTSGGHCGTGDPPSRTRESERRDPQWHADEDAESHRDKHESKVFDGANRDPLDDAGTPLPWSPRRSGSSPSAATSISGRPSISTAAFRPCIAGRRIGLRPRQRPIAPGTRSARSSHGPR